MLENVKITKKESDSPFGWNMRLNPRFYSHPSRQLMRLKKGLIKIWGNLAKKQIKTKHKTSEKKNRLCTRGKSVLMMGVAMGKCQKYIFVRQRPEIVSRPGDLISL